MYYTLNLHFFQPPQHYWLARQFRGKTVEQAFQVSFSSGSWSFFPLSLVGTTTLHATCTTRVVVLDEDNSLFDFRRCILNLVFADNSLFDNFFKRSSVDSSVL
jgi:hypothetical protein